MSGGFSDKLGNWYEQDYVCLLWLRMLAGDVESVTWEPAGIDEPGVDAWTSEEGRRIAHQCKSRGTGHWTAGALKAQGIPTHAREHLDRAGGADLFRLVTTTSAPDMSRLEEWAISDDGADALGSGPLKLVTALGFDLGESGTKARLRDLVSRIEVFELGRGPLVEQIRILAAQLVGQEAAERLIDALISLRSKEVLRRDLHVQQLRAELPPDLPWRDSVDAAPLLERAERLAERYVEEVRARRRIDPALERPEVRRLLGLVRSAAGARAILVHGAGGAGKSDVLACAVAEWPRDHGIVVPVLADEVEEVFGGDVSLKKLVLATGTGRLTILIDQLDQLLQAGGETQTLFRGASRLLREARRLGCTIVVGCRTTDAQFETQLHQMLFGGPGGSVESIEVEDLPEEAVAPVLARIGLPWASLSVELQRLVRRPFCLGIVQELASSDGWRGSRSIHELVDSWWGWIAGGDASKEHALEALVARMESDGSLAVDELSLPDHRGALRALERDRMLERDARNRLRPVHQLLVDMRLAKKLGTSQDADEASQRLGPRAGQGVKEARRLRHSVTLFNSRDAVGATILDSVYRSEGVRPLLKRAMLLGLRDERMPSPALVRVVLAWLDEPSHRELVAPIVLRGQGDWVVAARDWIERSWSQGDERQRDSLLHLLASVAVKQGDLVAELLEKWAGQEGSVLARAHMIFWQDPAEDTEALFRMRMAAPGPVGRPQEYLDWTKLFRANTRRAAALLAAVLQDTGAEVFRSAIREHRSFPRVAELDAADVTIGASDIWAELQSWWAASSVDSLHSIDTRFDCLPPAPIVDLVQILATCLAHLIEERALSWDVLLEQLPEPLRDLDGWLLLEIGAKLTGRTPQAAEAAAEWLLREERFAELKVGWPGRRHDHALVRRFVKAIAPQLSEDGYARLEAWVLGYRDAWSSQDEELRASLARDDGRLWPNHRGLMSYDLLPVLPEIRRSPRARARLAELQRKFDPVAETMLAPLHGGVGGSLGSKVPADVALRWTPQEWIARLRSAPEHDWKWTQSSEDSVEVYDRETLIRQLGDLARVHPRRFLPVAQAIADAGLPFQAELCAALLDSLGSAHPPGGLPAGEAWSPASDEEIVALLELSAFLENDEGALELGRVVEQRADYDWPDRVVGRLTEVALTGPTPAADPPAFEEPRREPLIEIELNDAPCSALRALTALATRHLRRHEQFLEVADRLVDRDPPARRAAAGVLAFHCRASDVDRASRLLLRACQDLRVAAQRSCLQALFALLDRSDALPETREESLGLLLRLAHDAHPQVAERGGRALVALRFRQRVDTETLRVTLRGRPLARRGAAEQLGLSLHRGAAEPWVLDYAAELADDEDDAVGATILRYATSAPSRSVLLVPEFASRLISSRAGSSERFDLLRALDEQARLGPVAELVLEIAARLLEPHPVEHGAGAGWGRYTEVRELEGLLARLLEECEREADTAMRARALDAWDRLIEARPRELGRIIDAETS